ncbi:MAG: NYN domain-containing protein [Mesorhizobium sp.]|nr:MAG: NYN domain-containing protein [Mesorhizobium sp.]TIW29542.1 MAG: NYN domain-containing protein [Mesorhizobium sp.]
MSDRQSPNVAVLIDTENVSAGYADRLFDQIASIGCATVRRGYGDFTGLWSAAWAKAFERHAITPRQQFSAGRGKNSADIALVIDAMDLLNQGAIGAICLVSGDSDFTPLALRIREQGVPLYGYGNAKSPERLRNACKKFTYLENMGFRSQPLPWRSSLTSPRPLQEAASLLRRAIAHAAIRDGWALIGEVELQLVRMGPDFDPRGYGVDSLLELVRRTRKFDVDLRDDTGPRLRLKRKASKQSGSADN